MKRFDRTDEQEEHFVMPQTPLKALSCQSSLQELQEDLSPNLISLRKERPAFTSVANCHPIAYQRHNERTAENKKSKKPTPQYVIHSLPNLEELLHKLSNCEKGNSKTKLRFVVTLDKQLYFAFEGTPNAWIPAHYQMANKDKYNARCLTAGNIYLRKQADGSYTLEKINHKSGDFTPHFDSLKWMLALLFAFETLLPQRFLGSELEIEELDQRGGHLGSWKLSKHILMKELLAHIQFVQGNLPNPNNQYALESTASVQADSPSADLSNPQRNLLKLFDTPIGTTEEIETQELYSEASFNAVKELWTEGSHEEGFDSPVKNTQASSWSPSS